MAIVTCSECRASLKVPETSLGGKVKCPKCGGVFVATAAASADDATDLQLIAAEARAADIEHAGGHARPGPGGPHAAAAPTYPSQFGVNVFVFLVLLAYAGFFVAVHPDVGLLDLGLVRKASQEAVPTVKGGKALDLPPPPPMKAGAASEKKGLGKKDKGKKGKTPDAAPEKSKEPDAKDAPKNDQDQSRRMPNIKNHSQPENAVASVWLLSHNVIGNCCLDADASADKLGGVRRTTRGAEP